MKEILDKINTLRVKSGVVDNQITQLLQEEEELNSRLKELGYSSVEELGKALDGIDATLETKVDALNKEVTTVITSVEAALS